MSEKLQLQQKLIDEKLAAQKKISRAILQTQERERTQIGGELHDNVCQLLTTAKLYFENTRYIPEQRDEFTKKGIELILQSINEIRFLSRQLVTPVIPDAGFKATLEELIKHYESLNVFEIDFCFEATEEKIEKDLKLAVYRILQEQFNNTVKYAKASLVQVTITENCHDLEVHYKDNGIGFDPSTPKKGLGLKNIRNRADAFRGCLEIKAAPGEGCQVNIHFPLSAEEGNICFN
jgi:signal transduction histidine kinase